MNRRRVSLVAGIVATIVVVAAVPAAFAALHAAPKAPANCVRDQLGVRSNGTNGAAGTIHGAWVFTNLTTTTCKLNGYPSMQLYGKVGRPFHTVMKNDLMPAPANVTLAPGGSATFLSRFSDVPSGTGPCPMSAVATIFAPNATRPLIIPAKLNPCGGIVHVSAVEAGVHGP